MSLERRHPELFEHPKRYSGACGAAMVVDTSGTFSQKNTQRGLEALENMEHRGGRMRVFEEDGTSCETGDGAGILMNFEKSYAEPHLYKEHQVPDGEVPLAGTLFIPREKLNGAPSLQGYEAQVSQTLRSVGLVPLGFREVATYPEKLARDARKTAPRVIQFFFGKGNAQDEKEVNRRIFAASQKFKQRWEATARPNEPIEHLASIGRNVVLKVLGTSAQLPAFYRSEFIRLPKSSIVVIHRREATNTSSTWENVQPLDTSAENGENNAVAENRNEVRRLENAARARGEAIRILGNGASDSRDYDGFLGYLRRREGMSLERAVRSTVLPVWWERRDLSHAARQWCARTRDSMGGLSAWGEGPKLILASDGITAVAASDRMAYRPAWLDELDDGSVIISSDQGCIPFHPSEIKTSRRLRGGDIVAVTTGKGSVRFTSQIHEELLHEDASSGRPLSSARRVRFTERNTIETPQQVLTPKNLISHGWTKEDLAHLDLWLQGEVEPRGAMGRDWAPAALSLQHPHLNNYALPILASCTNPANDPELEGGAVDTSTILGNREVATYGLDQAIVTPQQLAHIIENVQEQGPHSITLNCSLDISHCEEPPDVKTGGALIAERIDELISKAVEMVKAKNASIIVLTHKECSSSKLPLPMALVTSAINEALVREGLNADIVVHTPEVRHRHDLLVLYQCGASAICPSTIFARAAELGTNEEKLCAGKLRDAIAKAMSLAGVTSFTGYKGAKLIEWIGMGEKLSLNYFPGFVSKVSGIELPDMYEDMLFRRDRAAKESELPKWREARKLPKEVTKQGGHIQNLAITGDFAHYLAMIETINEQGYTQFYDLLETGAVGPSIPLEEVISEEKLLKKKHRYCI